MRSAIRAGIVLIVCLTYAPCAHAESSEFSTVVGTVTKIDKDTLTIQSSDKSAKKLDLKVTGTSRFHLLSPQVRSGKTVITQRAAETSDLSPGQAIAAIYTFADKEPILLAGVIKAEKELDKK